MGLWFRIHADADHPHHAQLLRGSASATCLRQAGAGVVAKDTGVQVAQDTGDENKNPNHGNGNGGDDTARATTSRITGTAIATMKATKVATPTATTGTKLMVMATIRATTISLEG